MSNIHPFELYKQFISMRTHFSTLKFIYGFNNLKLKYENFYRTRNHIQFEKYSKKWSTEHAEELFIANLLIDNKMSIHKFDTKVAEENVIEWKTRLKNIDSLFYKDMKKLISYLDIDDFKLLIQMLKNIEKQEDVTVDIDNILNIKIEMKKEGIHNYIIKNLNPETVIILNQIILQKYDFDFMKECIKMKIEPKNEFLKIYKYSNFIDILSVIQKRRKINEFYKMI